MKVGPERPVQEIVRGVYTGPSDKMRGQTALISRCKGGWVIQADDREGVYCFGWWKFPFEDWRAL